MKRFLKAFSELFVAIFAITFILLMAYYCKNCDRDYTIGLICISIFIPIYAFFNSFRQLQSKTIKWLYLVGIIACGIYLILNGFRYLFIEKLESNRFYSILSMFFIALGIGTLLLLTFESFRTCFSKETKFQLSDIVHFKKIFNLLTIVVVSIIITYPTNLLTLHSSLTLDTFVRIRFDNFALQLGITLGCYLIGSIIFEIIFYKYLKTDKIYH